jgi:predicted transcriptional regulator
MATIKAKDFIQDLRSGMDDPTLMLKYNLSHDDLQKVFEKLVEADFITVLELHERSRLSDTQVTKAFVDAQKAIDEIEKR